MLLLSFFSYFSLKCSWHYSGAVVRRIRIMYKKQLCQSPFLKIVSGWLKKKRRYSVQVDLKLQHRISRSNSSIRCLKKCWFPKAFMWRYLCGIAEAVVQRCSVKNAFVTISQNLQENTCAEVFLVKLQVRDIHLYKKETPAQVFSGKSARSFRSTIFYNIWLSYVT